MMGDRSEQGSAGNEARARVRLRDSAYNWLPTAEFMLRGPDLGTETKRMPK